MEQLSINSQVKSFTRYCAQYAKQGIVAELNCGAVVCWTQSTMIFLNGIFLSSAVTEEVDLRRRLEKIKTYVAKAQPTFPWMFYIEPELLPTDIRKRSREICLAAQFAHVIDVNMHANEKLAAPCATIASCRNQVCGIAAGRLRCFVAQRSGIQHGHVRCRKRAGK